jgi:ABC-type nitrate/sulfonate/bicarbonate transport system permease component
MKPSGEIIPGREKEGSGGGPRHRYLFLSILSVLLGIVAWQVTARFASKLFFAGPWETGAAFVDLLRSGDLQPDLWVSGLEFSYGFGL